MVSLPKLLSSGRNMSWGVETEINGKPLFIAKECEPLIAAARKNLELLLNAAERYAAMDEERRERSGILRKYPLLGGEHEATIIRVRLAKGLQTALKLYKEDERNGLDYFEHLQQTRRDDVFDTLTPYLATEDYILTDLIPKIPAYDDFVEQHADKKMEMQSLLHQQQEDTAIGDVGFDIDDGITPNSFDSAKHVHVAKFQPACKELKDRYRFFVFDMMY